MNSIPFKPTRGNNKENNKRNQQGKTTNTCTFQQIRTQITEKNKKTTLPMDQNLQRLAQEQLGAGPDQEIADLRLLPSCSSPPARWIMGKPGKPSQGSQDMVKCGPCIVPQPGPSTETHAECCFWSKCSYGLRSCPRRFLSHKP